MKLYLISQTENFDYDTLDSAVVCAESEEAARDTHPNGHKIDWENTDGYSWACKRESVRVRPIGESYNLSAGVIAAALSQDNQPTHTKIMNDNLNQITTWTLTKLIIKLAFAALFASLILAPISGILVAVIGGLAAGVMQ